MMTGVGGGGALLFFRAGLLADPTPDDPEVDAIFSSSSKGFELVKLCCEELKTNINLIFCFK